MAIALIISISVALTVSLVFSLKGYIVLMKNKNKVAVYVDLPELKLEPKPNKTKKSWKYMLRKTFWIFSAYKKYLKEVWRKNFTNLW
jgi:hypothetical protein